MKDWQRIRAAREDLTDYVVHLTKHAFDPFVRDGSVFKNILLSGHIKPTFAPKISMNRLDARPTVKGPSPAVCLTEQPLSALLQTLPIIGSRYSSFGVAYHKEDLHAAGGRPVLYGTNDELGRLIRKDEAGWEDGKEIYTGGLPPHLQYLWVRYEPEIMGHREYPIDFTWEREWRIKANGRGLRVVLRNDTGTPARGALIVPKDRMVQTARKLLRIIAGRGNEAASRLTKIISLESARRGLDSGDKRYGRIDTWPSDV